MSDLLDAMRCDTIDYKRYVDWYKVYLSKKLQDLPPGVVDVLSKVQDVNDKLAAQEFLLRCLHFLVQYIGSHDNVHFAQVEEELKRKGWVQDNPRAMAGCPSDRVNRDMESGSTSAKVTKLVFFGLGVLSFLYDPTLILRQNPSAESTSSSSDGRSSAGSLGASRITAAHCQGSTLKDIIWALNDRTPLSRLRRTAHYGVGREDALLSLNVNYYTLSQLVKVEIEWTETASRHLELDTRNKILRLFRYPSFCALMCGPQQGDNELASPGSLDRCYLNRCVWIRRGTKARCMLANRQEGSSRIYVARPASNPIMPEAKAPISPPT
jgi:hypothetical protein